LKVLRGYSRVTIDCDSLCSAIVSFGKISDMQKKEADELGVSCFSWEEFPQLVWWWPWLLLFHNWSFNSLRLIDPWCHSSHSSWIYKSSAMLPIFWQGSLDCELPPKHKTDVCTIMYTSGTTGEPKGVILTNGALVAEVLSVDQLLFLTDRVVNN
jgi:long-chain acyl-CoA synthetase